jgi:hypothetical protein
MEADAEQQMPTFSAYSRYAYSSYIRNLSDACNKFIKPR